MHIKHHGGKHTVTGSCHELFVSKQHSVLIDCGLKQGDDLIGEFNEAMRVDFDLQHIQALIITHTHIDHIGRIPWLLAAGYRGPIFATPATAKLIPLMLDDGLKIQSAFSDQQRAGILTWLAQHITPVPYDQWVAIPATERSRFRFKPAGHIIGSAYVEIDNEKAARIVFSGDLGPQNTPLLPDPMPPERADYLFIETTYGNRRHERIDQRRARLMSIIDRSLRDGGAIIIPSFSVGRTQELLFDFEQLIFEQNLGKQLPVIVDSPLAAEITQHYREFKALWSDEAKDKLTHDRLPLAFDQCIVIETAREHHQVVQRLKRTGQAAIVIAASGMCQGGRVMDYLTALLPDTRTDVIFTGYQPRGTLGRRLQCAEKLIEIDQQAIRVLANVHTMSGYSAHADQRDLLRFIEGISGAIKEVHLIHGAPRAKAHFKAQLALLNKVKTIVD